MQFFYTALQVETDKSFVLNHEKDQSHFRTVLQKALPIHNVTNVITACVIENHDFTQQIT